VKFTFKARMTPGYVANTGTTVIGQYMLPRIICYYDEDNAPSVVPSSFGGYLGFPGAFQIRNTRRFSLTVKPKGATYMYSTGVPTPGTAPVNWISKQNARLKGWQYATATVPVSGSSQAQYVYAPLKMYFDYSGYTVGLGAVPMPYDIYMTFYWDCKTIGTL